MATPSEELYLFTINDGTIYAKYLEPLYRKWLVRMRGGTYDKRKALVEVIDILRGMGIPKYRREIDKKMMFSLSSVRTAAAAIRNRFEAEAPLILEREPKAKPKSKPRRKVSPSVAAARAAKKAAKARALKRKKSTAKKSTAKKNPQTGHGHKVSFSSTHGKGWPYRVMANGTVHGVVIKSSSGRWAGVDNRGKQGPWFNTRLDAANWLIYGRSMTKKSTAKRKS